jgi:hypothetical protein
LICNIHDSISENRKNFDLGRKERLAETLFSRNWLPGGQSINRKPKIKNFETVERKKINPGANTSILIYSACAVKI